MTELKQKTVLVTGASSGIGKAIAVRAAHLQANLILHYCQNQKGVENTAKEVREQGVKCDVLSCDFANDHSQNDIERFANDAWQINGGIDVLVNNAGGDVLTNSRKDWSVGEKLDYLWKVDVLSCIQLSRSIGHKMQSQNSKGDLPAIINIGWDQAELGQGGDSGEIFATTKGAIMCFTKSLAKSLAPSVRVNCVAPGWIQTSWGEKTSNYWNERARSESLLNRWGTPTDIANTVCFLVSKDAEFINGQIIPVNGGLNFGKK